MRKAETTNTSPSKSFWHLFTNKLFKHHGWETCFLEAAASKGKPWASGSPSGSQTLFSEGARGSPGLAALGFAGKLPGVTSLHSHGQRPSWFL